ncbi:Protein ASI2 [Nakaseomyces bracarensis]|uniref:Protein ASI2 n=1 Tax=Nakaseomyces bracarensis TaxID=273131 RepID=A0ABR4NUV8_9SACH
MSNQDSDLNLYERYLEERQRLQNREDAHEIQTSDEVLQRNLDETLSQILRNWSQEIDDNHIPNVSLRRRVGSLRSGGNEGAGIHGPAEQRTPFAQRPSFFRTLVRNLLVFNYLVLSLLFPFSLYNVLRSGFSTMTFSERDFTREILTYWYAIDTVDVISLIKPSTPETVDSAAGLGLLGKFHNIIVYYSLPIGEQLLRAIVNIDKSYPDIKDYTFRIGIYRMLLSFLFKWYKKGIKIGTVVVYLTYGIGGTTYLMIAGFFFSLCVGLTVVRRYKSTQQILSGL